MRGAQNAKQEAYPQGVFQLFRLVQNEAQAGRPVEEGGVTEFWTGSAPLLPAAPALRALIWLRAQPLQGVLLPAGRYLAGVFVFPLEQAVAKSHGATRLAAMLGHAANYYPTPYWTDPARAPLITDDKILEKSLINAFRAPLATLRPRDATHLSRSARAHAPRSRHA